MRIEASDVVFRLQIAYKNRKVVLECNNVIEEISTQYIDHDADDGEIPKKVHEWRKDFSREYAEFMGKFRQYIRNKRLTRSLMQIWLKINGS